MKKATLIIWLLIFGFIALVIYQNYEFFTQKQSLLLNLGVTNPYTSPALPIAIYFIIFFLAGIVIAYLFNFSPRFKARRTHKKLNATIEAHEKKVSELKREIETLKGIERREIETLRSMESPATTPPADMSAESEAVIELTNDNLIKNPGDQKDKASARKPDTESGTGLEDTAYEKKP